MAQHPIEVILAKQFASHLTMPIFIVDPTGRLVFYNEPAELLLGHRYDETGEMPVEEWGSMFQPVDLDGNPIEARDLPLVRALEKREAAHRRIRITAMDGVERNLAITAFPIEGEGDRHLGAVALFWEDGRR